MFSQLKNIDTAFKHIRAFSLVLILCCAAISCFAIYQSFRAADSAQNRIYILSNGKALEALTAGRRENIPVEAKDHIGTFHQLFFNLDPDDKLITANVSKALYLADHSAKAQYDDLRESGYYASLVSGNISQEITIDSVQLDINQYPYHFRCYATQRLIRATAKTTRSLVTQGYLRNVARSDNNPHGFLIQQWETILNSDQIKKGE
ncbi:Bacteroides conjugative transposon TraK protein [Mucilaginibacter pineti]|uniref:Bacteroides conjugative transposon TraK protein n=1 Tax=Mucilaginibacter pineti TaxID=1391627 RepID=A0A1G7EPU8_9SPHI|nr:conjugative transposon protein TraK [Mucilaginibacter pineti]SDE65684.1 Bacteroides conjugative transposon TraK protein [Mucilaginibacter pineti]